MVLQNQLQALEIKQAYQEETIESLSDTLALQQQDIINLKHQLSVLSEYLKTLKSEGDSGIKFPAEEQRPPHY